MFMVVGYGVVVLEIVQMETCCSLILTIECSILIERSIYIIECRKFSCGVYIPYFL